MPPIVAQSPIDTRMSQCLRKSRRTSTFSSLQQPPSINPMSTGPRELLNNHRSATCRNRPSRSVAECAHRYRATTCDSRNIRPARSWRLWVLPDIGMAWTRGFSSCSFSSAPTFRSPNRSVRCRTAVGRWVSRSRPVCAAARRPGRRRVPGR